ncbi:MAG: hypothetical protein NZ534_02460, partial [Bacteroidia bacterium]|nr:hypothetical protein [Bacteroidia bacterium]
MKELVNPNGNFIPVYGLYCHERFGYLIGAYVVETDAAGNPTLKYQRLLPENYSSFAHKLDENDKKLTHILYEISVDGLYKQFGAKEAGLGQFLERFNESAYKQLLWDYIERRKIEAFALLAKKRFFLKSKDGYPVWKPLTIVSEKAKIKFYFHRNEKETLYWIKLVYQGLEYDLNTDFSGVLTQSPAWLLWNQLIVPLEEQTDGKKLIPFIKKKCISIPRHQEKEYYSKFLLRLLETHEVD